MIRTLMQPPSVYAFIPEVREMVIFCIRDYFHHSGDYSFSLPIVSV